ncbi:MAG: NADH-quinone oxidoreductase subunit NuoE [Oscillospiraceae bacterium]|nr:NADH-quinone oxidoreductase subunit NuoE [Oscillospiraceae bacterium]
MKSIQTVPFTGTKEQEQEFRGWLNEHGNVPGIMMQALQKAQGVYGYLPKEALVMAAEELNVSLEELYGIATFYSQFRLAPIGKYKISVCLGTACYVKGSQNIHNKFETMLGIEDGGTTPDGKFSLESCRCIGACGLAPVITINSDVYGKLTGNELESILAKY